MIRADDIGVVHHKPLDVLWIQDDWEDLRLMMETVHETGLSINLRVLRDDLELGGFRGLERPDLIFLDLQMRNAWGILTEITQDEDLKNIPLAVIGPASEEVIDSCFEDAADVYITKPIDPERLIMTLNWAQGL